MVGVYFNSGRRKITFYRTEASCIAEGEIFPIIDLLPAIRAFTFACARGERSIAVLQVFEALRMYGAAHEGRLPAELSDITMAPVPEDPMHCKPFAYRCENNIAILESAHLRVDMDPEYYHLRYEIQICVERGINIAFPRRAWERGRKYDLRGKGNEYCVPTQSVGTRVSPKGNKYGRYGNNFDPGGQILSPHL